MFDSMNVGNQGSEVRKWDFGGSVCVCVCLNNFRDTGV